VILRRAAICLALLIVIQACSRPIATPGPGAGGGPVNYADRANWLCWPGRNDACAADLTTTVVRADSSTSIEAFRADPQAPIDCFYVYPTVSRDAGPVSSLKVQPEETGVVVQQAARLRAACRLYAPMYRQFTLSALGAAMRRGRAADTKLGYGDLKAAWTYYMEHENRGRGVVLVGHSQGARLLIQLIRDEIDSKPEQATLVSAILMGTVLPVPVGKDVGGGFRSIPLCRSTGQVGCAIAYGSYLDTRPAPPHGFFGRAPAWGLLGQEAACASPANLAGGAGPAKAYFGVRARGSLSPDFVWLKSKAIDTPFVTVPGLITAQCVRQGGFNYVSVHLNANPTSLRSSDIPTGDAPRAWGLHAIEANLFMGNLVDIVHDEGQAWVKKGS
jgi:hypothetical protein